MKCCIQWEYCDVRYDVASYRDYVYGSDGATVAVLRFPPFDWLPVVPGSHHHSS